MPRLLYRRGPWLLLAAVMWYLSGNHLIKTYEERSLARAESLHKTSQDFAVGSQGSVVVHADGEGIGLRAIGVDFDSTATSATVINENIRVVVSGETVDGVLHITLNGLDGRGYRQSKKPRIVLPSSVKKLGFSGSGEIEVAGRLPDPKSVLSLDSLSCASSLRVSGLTVNQLKIKSTCQSSAEDDERCCSPHIHVEKDAGIEMLHVSMEHGSFQFSGGSIPQTELHLGEMVKVTARRAFLEAARVGKLQP